MPQESIPCIIGRPQYRFAEVVDGIELKEEMIGFDASQHRTMLEIFHPMAEGMVKNWDDMMKLWAYSFDKVGYSDLSNTKVLLTEAPFNPIEMRRKLAEIMFEQFRVEAANVEIQATLSLYALGYMSGMVVDSGDGVTHCIPVSEGQVDKHHIGRLNLAGRHLTEYLVKLLLMRGYGFNSTADFELVREIKENLCYASRNLSTDRKLADETTVLEADYKLPDGSFIKIGRERFEACEALFKPVLVGREEPGISEMIFNSIMGLAIDERPKFFSNIILSGGSTMYPGMSDRIKYDLRKLHNEMRGKQHGESKRISINVEDPPNRRFLVYVGGATLADLMANQDSFWRSREDYFEQGEEVFLHNRIGY